jgi:hypothetical protein
MEIREAIQVPLNNMDNDVQGTFRQIAENLFSKFCIKCGETEYYFAEIEFYFYEKSKWEEDWNKVTYARDGYDAGDLFYHSSGIDICFDSSCNKKDNIKFGGILVRAIMDKNDNMTAGPWNCMLKILNTCKSGTMPKVEGASPRGHMVEIQPTHRALGKEDMEKEEKSPLSLCFYDANTLKEKWNPKKEVFNSRKGVFVPKYSSYKTNRFELIPPKKN